MRRSTLILSLVVAALAVTSIWTWRLLLEERSRADALQTRIDVIEGPGTELLPAPAGGAGDGSGGAIAAAADDDPAHALTGEDIHADKRRLLQNESYREARRRFRQLELARGHVDLARVLGISQETADRLLALLVDRELMYSDRPFYNPRNEKELRIRQMEVQQAQYERDAAIAAVIGAENLPHWKEYQASLRERHWVRDMSARMTGEAEPLRDEQAEKLIAAIYSERRRMQQELNEFSENLVWTDGMEPKSQRYRSERQAELARVTHDRIRDAAAPILSSRQLAVLDDWMRRERAYQDAEEAQSRAWEEAQRVSGGGGG